MRDALLHSKDILAAMMNGVVVPHKRDEELLRYYAVILDEALKREGRRCPVNAASCNLRRLFERYPYMCSEQKPKNGVVMVEALKSAISRAEEAMGYVFRSSGPKACMEELINECKEALCAPPRNCDVGTAEEQAKRFHEFCHAHRTFDTACSDDCPFKDAPDINHCQSGWGQLPYDAAQEGGK